MNVLMLISKIEPSKSNVLVGGSANALVNLCNILHEEVGVTVLAGGRDSVNELVPGFFSDRVKVHTLSCIAPAQSVWYGAEFAVRSVIRALRLRSHDIDVVHGHSGYGIYAWITWIVSKLLRAKSVHTIYCPMQQRSEVLGRKALVLSSSWAARGLGKMTMVLAMTANIENSICRAGIDRARVRYVPSALDFDRFSESAQKNELESKLGLPAHRKIFLFVGNLSDSKGIWDLLEAFRDFSMRGKDGHLVITLEISHKGFDERLERLEREIDEFGLRDRVTRLGFINFMSQLVAAAHCLIVPYRDTQGPSDFPLILMEAMVSGTPIIGTRIGGIPELLQNGTNGWLVDPRSPDQLMVAMEESVSDIDAGIRKAERARSYVDDSFGSAKVRNEHLAVYRYVIQEGGI